MSVSIYAGVIEEDEWRLKPVIFGAEAEFQNGGVTFGLYPPSLPEPPGVAAGYTYWYGIDQNLDEQPVECRCTAFAGGRIWFYVPSLDTPEVPVPPHGPAVVEIPVLVESSPASFEPLTRRTSDGDLSAGDQPSSD